MALNRPLWVEAKAEFSWDGSLRDIYVAQTTAADWNLLPLAFALAGFYLRYSSNGQSVSPPNDFATLVRHRGEQRPYLELRLGMKLAMDCHFFRLEEIEFSFDPREIRSEREFELLLSFMEFLGTTVRKPVLLTPENAIHLAILTFDPTSDSWTRT